VDVASDVAFLAMDLDYENRGDLSRYFAEKMAESLDDPGMSGLINFYKCYRAYVRGKVESLHSVTRGASEAERSASAEHARRYFRLALQYTVAGSEPLVLVIMGGTGSGKSTLARSLGTELNWPVFSSDRIRKKLAGVPLYERGSKKARSRLYSSEMTEKTYNQLLGNALSHAQEGRSVILDATFGDPARRERLKRSFLEHRIKFRAVETQANAAEVKKRLEERGGTGEISDARLEDFSTIMRSYHPPSEWSGHELLTVQTNRPLKLTVASVLGKLAQAEMQWSVRS